MSGDVLRAEIASAIGGEGQDTQLNHPPLNEVAVPASSNVINLPARVDIGGRADVWQPPPQVLWIGNPVTVQAIFEALSRPEALMSQPAA